MTWRQTRRISRVVKIGAVAQQTLSQARERVRAPNRGVSLTAEAGRGATISVAKKRVSRDAPRLRQAIRSRKGHT